MPEKETIHIIDDEKIIHEVLEDLLVSEGYQCELSSNGQEALRKHKTESFDLVLLDLLMPGMNGIEVLQEIKKIDPHAVVIIITAYASVESAITAMKKGAFDYIQKPFQHDELLITLRRAIKHKKLQEENIQLKDQLKRKFSFDQIIGKSKNMQDVFAVIKAAAPTRSTILIQGESGTGKELVAKAIHHNSQRVNFPFITVNSGSLPPELLESHLFGHVKGAFTGAVSQKKGLFEAADKGSIFFDEISSLNLETQAKLLRVLQEKEFMRLGGTKTIKVDTRVIAATNTDLEELINKNHFREDLFYRLNVIKIEIPPLRERKEDIPLLVRHFLELYSKENHKENLKVTEDLMELLENYSWPGNVRELENLIERTVVLTRSKIIGREQIPSFLLKSKITGKTDLLVSDHNLKLKERTRIFQKNAVIDALKKSNGIQKKAADLLGVKPTTLNEMIKRLNIETNSSQKE
ncbi:MAG: sigma-54-dependent Fis family transcriptional regulator [Candidatus Aminicenantes bacterium]|nr:sigma-54-dependent Fis family transcriptional regulator [Candidatus Aminicenantes bacterium]